MQKKQPSHILPLYIFCALLIFGLGASFLFEKNPQTDEAEREALQSVQDIPTQLKISHAVIDLKETHAPLIPEDDETEFFQNMFSVFTELDENDDLIITTPKKGITVSHFSKKIEEDITPLPAPPLKTAPLTGAAKVIIIIDDMGISRKWSQKMAELEGPLTLAYLPYAEDLQAQADYASAHNHHLMLHMPMEALAGKMASTPGLLTTNTTQDEFLNQFYTNLNSFEGFAGINNHMGSRLTQDRTKMTLVMNALKKNNLYFIDSRTIHNSVAADIAEETQVPYLVRDVFLDHEETLEYARNALRNLEQKAIQNGAAIAIGHPKEMTYLALQEWLPTLKAKNIELVSAGALITQKYPQVQVQAYQVNNAADIIPAAGHIVGSITSDLP